MSKSILIIDKVDKCCQCPMAVEDGDCCCIKDEFISWEQYVNKKPDWCPLKEIPQKANHPDYCDNGRYDKGWSDCIDELLKGDEEE